MLCGVLFRPVQHRIDLNCPEPLVGENGDREQRYQPLASDHVIYTVEDSSIRPSWMAKLSGNCPFCIRFTYTHSKHRAVWLDVNQGRNEWTEIGILSENVQTFIFLSTSRSVSRSRQLHLLQSACHQFCFCVWNCCGDRQWRSGIFF